MIPLSAFLFPFSKPSTILRYIFISCYFPLFQFFTPSSSSSLTLIFLSAFLIFSHLQPSSSLLPYLSSLLSTSIFLTFLYHHSALVSPSLLSYLAFSNPVDLSFFLIFSSFVFFLTFPTHCLLSPSSASIPILSSIPMFSVSSCLSHLSLLVSVLFISFHSFYSVISSSPLSLITSPPPQLV